MNPLAEYEQVAGLPDQALVERHADLVRRIAYHLIGRLPDSVDVNDLIQTGMLGLMEAARHYKDDRGANFETYAGIRIRGAMLDELRRGDWSPRSVHRKSREMAEALASLEKRLGRSAEPAEIAEEMDIPLDEYFRIVQDATQSKMLSADELTESGALDTASGHEAAPEKELQHQQLQDSIAEAVENLPKREKILMGLYYEQEMNLREVGEVLGVSESRVCQLHGQALIRIRNKVSQQSE